MLNILADALLVATRMQPRPADPVWHRPAPPAADRELPSRKFVAPLGLLR